MTIINFVVYDECENVTNPVAYDEDVIIQESLDTKIYVFKNGLKILNSQKYLNEKIGTHIKDGAQITFLRKMGLHYSI